ncbi:MAG TPA: hypothetical protein VGM39_05000 [Kofleriaceae bacterium]|jgi:hypothetical protein
MRTVGVAQNTALRESRHDDGQLRELAQRAIVHFERALRLPNNNSHRLGLFPRIADAALEAGAPLRAAVYADSAVALAKACPAERHVPDYLHEAHIVKGHVALAANNIAEATRLLALAATFGGPQAPVLRSFGPDFTLANALLARGELAAVRAYLGACATFWEPERIARWQARLDRGEHPFMHTGYERPTTP